MKADLHKKKISRNYVISWNVILLGLVLGLFIISIILLNDPKMPIGG